MNSFEALPFFRGVSARFNAQHPSIHETRRDRSPRNTSTKFHSIADEWFYSKFGVHYRSHVLFLTPLILTAQTYAATHAHVMRILPLSDYRYCWSPKKVDLLFSAKELEVSSRNDIEKHLTLLDYREDGLAEAHALGHEVMLHCDKYISIPIHLVETNKQESAKNLILVDKHW